MPNSGINLILPDTLRHFDSSRRFYRTHVVLCTFAWVLYQTRIFAEKCKNKHICALYTESRIEYNVVRKYLIVAIRLFSTATYSAHVNPWRALFVPSVKLFNTENRIARVARLLLYCKRISDVRHHRVFGTLWWQILLEMRKTNVFQSANPRHERGTTLFAYFDWRKSPVR